VLAVVLAHKVRQQNSKRKNLKFEICVQRRIDADVRIWAYNSGINYGGGEAYTDRGFRPNSAHALHVSLVIEVIITRE
jgi:hypothetical protein